MRDCGKMGKNMDKRFSMKMRKNIMSYTPTDCSKKDKSFDSHQFFIIYSIISERIACIHDLQAK